VSAAAALRDRRVLVLGATGFIGRWAARAAHQAGARVWLAARRADEAARIASVYGLDGATTVALDVLDAAALAGVIRDAAPDVTFNLAGYGVDRTETDPALSQAINVELVRRVLDLIAAGPPSAWAGPRLVHTGSALEYGTVGGDLSEDGPVNPTTVYGQTKLTATRLVEGAVAAGRLRAVTARLFTVYGPGEHTGRLLPSVLASRSSASPVAMTNGLQQRDFTYVGDVAEGLVRAAARTTLPWATVNLATGRLRSVREFVGEAERALGLTPGRFAFGALPTRSDDMAHDAVTIERARQWLGWVPSTTIADGVRATDAFLASLPPGAAP
jgi:nucleoside-diphosphate-sugar epimerase